MGSKAQGMGRIAVSGKSVIGNFGLPTSDFRLRTSDRGFFAFQNIISYLCELNILLFVMFSSSKTRNDIVLAVYREARTVFRLNDIAMLVGEENFQTLNKKLNYYVRTGKLENPRKGIYTKPKYSEEELACSIFAPSYISLEYVLQKSGIVFQYDSRITSVSYLSRNIEAGKQKFVYRKIKGSALVNTLGITRHSNHINIATAERAFLDIMYLDKNCDFDNLNPLNRELVQKLLPIYESKELLRRVSNILKDD